MKSTQIPYFIVLNENADLLEHLNVVGESQIRFDYRGLQSAKDLPEIIHKIKVLGGEGVAVISMGAYIQNDIDFDRNTFFTHLVDLTRHTKMRVYLTAEVIRTQFSHFAEELGVPLYQVTGDYFAHAIKGEDSFSMLQIFDKLLPNLEVREADNKQLVFVDARDDVRHRVSNIVGKHSILEFKELNSLGRILEYTQERTSNPEHKRGVVYLNLNVVSKKGPVDAEFASALIHVFRSQGLQVVLLSDDVREDELRVAKINKVDIYVENGDAYEHISQPENVFLLSEIAGHAQHTYEMYESIGEKPVFIFQGTDRKHINDIQASILEDENNTLQYLEFPHFNNAMRFNIIQPYNTMRGIACIDASLFSSLLEEEQAKLMVSANMYDRSGFAVFFLTENVDTELASAASLFNIPIMVYEGGYLRNPESPEEVGFPISELPTRAFEFLAAHVLEREGSELRRFEY